MPVGIDPRVNFLARLFGLDDKPAEKPKRVQGITRQIGRSQVAVTTRQQEIERIARQNIERQRQRQVLPRSDFLDAYSSSVGNTLGIAPRIASVPRALISGRSFGDEFDIIQAEEEIRRSRSTLGNILGLVAGGAGAGRAAVSVLGRLASSGVPVIARAAQSLQPLTQLQRGRTLANAGKLSVVGAAAGGAQAAGEGSDIERGVAFGAAAGPVLVGGGKIAEVLSRPVRDVLRASSAAGILRRFTSSNAEDIAKKAEDFRRRTGTEPTVFELLPLEDRQGIQRMAGLFPGSARENLVGRVRARAANIGPELSRRVDAITDPQQRDLVRTLADRLAESRGAAEVSADDVALATRASRSPVDMEELGRVEAKNIMTPIEKTVLFEDIRQLFPTTFTGSKGRVTQIARDPAAIAAIKNAAGRLQENITGGDITKIIRRLESVPPTSTEAGAAERALDAIFTNLDNLKAPKGTRQIIEKMRTRFAEVQRIREGLNEGARSRLREAIPVQDRQGAQEIRNAFDTPEGALGRAAGQVARLSRDVSASPGTATRAVGEIAESPATQEAIARNIGPQARDDIVDAATAQTESARALATLSREQGSGFVEGASLPDLTRGLIALSPGSLAITKANVAARLLRLFSHLPEEQSNRIVDALFSQDPAKTSAALNLLNNAGDAGKTFLRQLQTDVVGGQLGAKLGDALGQVSGSVPSDQTTTDQPQDFSQMSDEELLQLAQQQEIGAQSQDFSQMSDEELLQMAQQQGEVPFGRSIVESVFPGAEITDDLRDPNSALGQANPGSFHVQTDAAVDVRPIPGLTFEQFLEQLQAAGHTILEARNEVSSPAAHATGPHWHVVFG